MSLIKDLLVPDIGDFNDVEVIEILSTVGDQIAVEDSLLVLETDKATMDVPSSIAGKIVEITVGVGDTISHGDLIARIEASEQQVLDDGKADDTEKNLSAEPADVTNLNRSLPAAQDSNQGIPEVRESPSKALSTTRNDFPVSPGKLPLASPSVRRFIRELGATIGDITGRGRAGRILKEDVKEHVKQLVQGHQGSSLAVSGSHAMDVLAWPVVDFSRFGHVTQEKLSRIQKISGANLHRNWVRIPHVTQNDEADITRMEQFRKAHKAEATERGAKMTPLIFLIKACVAALHKFPKFNASLDADGETLILKQYYHIGVAVDTVDGLVVPVIRDCERKSLVDLAVSLADISTRARDKKLKADEMQGGCFSISSLGGIGGTSFTPIINAPEVAILGVSKSVMKPVYQDSGEFLPRLMLPLSLSYDHRVIDGASAARFTAYLAHLLGDIRRLLL